MKRSLSLYGLAARSIAYHSRSYLYVMLAVATAAAIITGALLVGESWPRSDIDITGWIQPRRRVPSAKGWRGSR